MPEPDSHDQAEREYAPGRSVPTTGGYLALFAGGGQGWRILERGTKFPSRFLTHTVKYWTADRMSHPTQANLRPGDDVPRDGVYRAHYAGGSGDKKLRDEQDLPLVFGTHKVSFWTWVRAS